MRSSMDRTSSVDKTNTKERSPTVELLSQNYNGESNSSPKPRASILKKSRMGESSDLRNSRSDSLGNQIRPGSKKHKIQFRGDLCEIKEVESYKQYNIDDGDNYATKNCCCIF